MRVSRFLLAVATPSTLLSAASLAFSAPESLAVCPDSATSPNAAVAQLNPEQRALFDVPQAGLSVEIYQKRLTDADAFLRDVRETVDAETFATLSAEMRPVCVAALRNLADAPELSDDERTRYWGELVDRLTEANDYAALRALLRSEEDDANRVVKRFTAMSVEERNAASRQIFLRQNRVERLRVGYLKACLAVAGEREFTAQELISNANLLRVAARRGVEFGTPAPTAELFDVPTDQTVAFYQRRVLEIALAEPNADQAQIDAALQTIFLLLADADVPYNDAQSYLFQYASRFSQDDAKKRLEEEEAKEFPDSSLVFILETRAFGGQGLRQNAAQTPKPTSREAEPPFDESLLVVPDGETPEFYQKRLRELEASRQANARSNDSKSAKETRRLQIANAVMSINQRLADDSRLSFRQRRRCFDAYVEALANARQLDALRSLFEKEKAACDATSAFAVDRVDAIEEAIYKVRLYQLIAAVRELPQNADAANQASSPTLTPELETTLRTLEADILAKATAGEKRSLAGLMRSPFGASGSPERWAGLAEGFADSLGLFLPNDAKAFRKKLYDVVSTLEDPKDREIAERLERKIRVDDLLGAEFPVEGVLADGAEIDWASYRGKVVYFFVYNSAFLTSEQSLKDGSRFYHGERFAQLRAQYGAAGFAILLYDVASKPPKKGTAPNVFGVEPSDVLSRALTRDAEKDYADLSELYFSLDFTGSGFIVDVDGKVLDVRATALDLQTQRKLETLLQERFPDVDVESQN